MSWPGHINDVGGIRRQFHHIIDIAPTILEAAGIPQPDTINGIKQLPMEGVSMAYTWDPPCFPSHSLVPYDTSICHGVPGSQQASRIAS